MKSCICTFDDDTDSAKVSLGLFGNGITLKYNENSSPLIIACAFSLSEVVISLLPTEYATLDFQDNNKSTALICAIDNEMVQVVTEMLKYPSHCGLTLKDDNNHNALTSALLLDTRKGYLMASAILGSNLECGLSEQNESGKTPLMVTFDNIASFDDANTDIINKMLHHATDCGINKICNNGFTALMIAIFHGSEIFTNVVNSLKCNINIQNSEGETVLMYAVKSDPKVLLEPIIDLILNNKESNPHITNNKGETAFSIACDRNMQKIAMNMVPHMDINIHYNAMLDCASKNNLIELIHKLNENAPDDACMPVSICKQITKISLQNQFSTKCFTCDSENSNYYTTKKCGHALNLCSDCVYKCTKCMICRKVSDYRKLYFS